MYKFNQKYFFNTKGRDGKLSKDLKLPYTRACILEVMRVKTVVPLSIPRFTTSDAVVSGYHIPKGTEVCKNGLPLGLFSGLYLCCKQRQSNNNELI